jgi:beta-glucosidase
MLLLSFAVALLGVAGCPDRDSGHDPDADPDARARSIVAQMTLEQKIAQTHGSGSFSGDFRIVHGVPELGIPALTVTNGPAGVGPGPEPLGNVPATALPSPLLLAATWDPAMASKYGDVQGAEMRAIGRNLLEAPDVDLARVPINGRTFEAFGEDPVLISRLAVANIRAIQAHGVLAMVKHYAANNQERERASVDVVVSERALRELYLLPFEVAVREGEVASVMCSYNSVRGAFSCENAWLLRDVLKGEWGFRGFVQSDFYAVKSTIPTANAGMDLEMPSPLFFGARLRDAIEAGEVSEERLDDMLVRRYREMIRFGLFERDASTSPIPAEEHAAIAREIAAAGTVLLVNRDALLPLDPAQIGRLAVVGPWSTKAATGGGGSSMVNPIRSITPLEGLVRRLEGTGVEVVSDDGADPGAAAQLAASADVAIVVVGDFEREGVDRETLALPDAQDELVAAVAAANPRTVVVLHAGAPVLMPWVESVGAIVEGWYPGGEDGLVTAAMLFGDENPSGKLPITFPASDAQGPAAGRPARYPGVDGRVHYDEGLAVGYRWYDASGETPLFPFGYGLSYTSFRIGAPSVSPERIHPGDTVQVEVDVENEGGRVGAEVVQVYVAYPPELGEPPRQLRAFERVSLEPGETRRVRLTLDERSLAIWDEASRGWRVAAGSYTILVGTSSVDTPYAVPLIVDPPERAATERVQPRSASSGASRRGGRAGLGLRGGGARPAVPPST